MTIPVSLSQVSDALADIVDLFSSNQPKSSDAQGGLLSAITAAVNAAAGAPAAPRFDASDLYGASGLPRGADIDQDSIGDCYFLAVIGATAGRQPSRIQDAISYDAATGTFYVKMYKEEVTWRGVEAEEVRIPVTQQDLLDNISRRGGSTVDNKPGTDGPIWPAVLETAFAKMNDNKWSDGLDKGYREIAGGWPRDAMFALTGSKGTDYSAISMFSTDVQAELLYNQVDMAMREGRAVTLTTTPAEDRTLWDILNNSPGKQDGLVDNHVFMVDRIYKNSSGEVMVELRNPWGRNLNVGEGMDTASAKITVKLETLIETGGLHSFNAGPR